jgi:hypothetical protein
MEPRPDAAELTALWTLPTVTYGVGDLLTTMSLSAVASVREANPAVVAAFDLAGTPGFVALKLAVLFAGLALALRAGRVDDRLGYYGTPALLAVVGAFLTAYNLRLLIG